MRADRLITLIMLLETRGCMNARELSEELEVSQRTLYRDIEALCAAGIPVYGSPGPEGGYRLMEGYKSNLNGLTRDEILSLLTVNLSDHLDGLKLGENLKSALLKIRSSYSHIRKAEEEPKSRVYMDPKGWGSSNSPASGINLLYDAIASCRTLNIAYIVPSFPRSEFHRRVNPLGLVSKEGLWYLACSMGNKLRIIETSTILRVSQGEEYFSYPVDFNLREFWEAWCKERDSETSKFEVKLLVPMSIKDRIMECIGIGYPPITPLPHQYRDGDFVEATLKFNSFEEARSRLLGFGGCIRVVEPEALKYSLLDFAEQVINSYK